MEVYYVPFIKSDNLYLDVYDRIYNIGINHNMYFYEWNALFRFISKCDYIGELIIPEKSNIQNKYDGVFYGDAELVLTKKIKDYPNYEKICEKFLQYFPICDLHNSLLSYWLCKVSLYRHGCNLHYINCKTTELCEIAINNGAIMSDVPKYLLTYDMCLYFVMQNVQNIRLVPKYLLTDELYNIIMVNHAYNLLMLLPKQYKTPNLCSIAVKMNPLLFRHVPKKLRTFSICKNAISIITNIIYIPKKHETVELYKYILSIKKDENDRCFIRTMMPPHIKIHNKN